MVEVYNGLKQLAEENEALLPQLSAACHAYIVDCRDKYPSVPLGDYIEQRTEKNNGNCRDIVMGLSTKKEFREPNSRVNKKELSGYKLIDKDQLAYVPTTDTWKVFACALAKDDFVVSPIYCVFKIIDTNVLSPEFLYIYFKRAEFDRYARYNSWGSARENFSFSELEAVQIPLPPIEVQQAIVDVYECAERAKKIAIEARERLKNLCPALVQRAAHS